MENKKRSDFLTLFYIIFTLLSFCLVNFYFRMNMGVRKVGYLYQRFQRGKYIAFFTSLTMSVLMIALSLGAVYSVSSINSWFVFIAMSSVSIIFAVLLQIKEYLMEVIKYLCLFLAIPAFANVNSAHNEGQLSRYNKKIKNLRKDLIGIEKINK